MKKFLYQIVSFGFLFFLLISVSFLVCFNLSSRKIDWTLESSKTILIAGDSYPECALNDSILSNAINLSSSADTYIYSYVKIRKFITHNPQIKTVLLGISYHNLMAKNDSFFKSASPGISKFIRYFYLMGESEIDDIFHTNYNIVVTALGSCYQKSAFYALTPVRRISFERLGLGGFRRLAMHHLKENLDVITKVRTANPAVIRPSQVQIHYLEEIIHLCKMSGIQLILLNTPVHPMYKISVKAEAAYFSQFCEQKRIQGYLWDYSDYSMPDSCFADAEHLNYQGAAIFSRMIRDKTDNIN
jgi:hypothetical protein